MSNLTPSDPNFFPQVRSLVRKRGGIDETFEKIEASLFQEGSSYLALKRARRYASVLVDGNGVIDADRIQPLIKELEDELYPIGMEKGIEKGLFQLRALKKLKISKELLQILGTVDLPYREPLGEKWIRISLGLQKKDPLQKRHAIQAVLSAWLTPLRQNVGSCFATAPAIEIQEEHPELLLKDLKDLLETGRLKRVVQGVEHQAPLVSTIGFGSLKSSVPFNMERTIDSPSLKKAFDAMEVPLSHLRKIFSKNPPPYISADEIINESLKSYLGIDQRDVSNFLDRELSQPLPSLLIRPANGGTGSKVTEYLDKLELGRLTFILMTEHPFLKAWEYTLASFAETKGDFASWNLYASLGFQPEDVGGIGGVLYQTIQAGLDASNRKMLDVQDEYQAAYLQLVTVESRIKVAQSEKELRWIQADYQSKKNEFNTLEILRDREKMRGEKLANLPNFLVNHFMELFPKYFQEVYDPDLQEVKIGPFDDAPAGFRLVFKHGRQSISAWSPIRGANEFVESLASFFQSSEREFEENEIKGIEREITDVITAICLHVRSKVFLETAFDRMAKAHHLPPIRDPLQNLDKIEKKPWAFTSGGTMKGLITSYLSLDEPPTEITRWVENREELLIFLIDELKRLPNYVSRSFQENPDKGMLMNSPTHAFRLLPNFSSPFKEAWKQDIFTYTWVRDEMVEPQKSFYRNLTLDDAGFEKMKAKVSLFFPKSLRESFMGHLRSPAPWVSIPHFRELIFEAFKKDPNLFSFVSSDEIDALLFRSLPLTTNQKFYNLSNQLLSSLSLKDTSSELTIPSLLTRGELRDALLASIALASNRGSFPFDLEEKIILLLRKERIEPPPAILFADTNWEGGYFAFQVNPGTLDLDLWRLNRLGTNGAPMTAWRGWLDGSRRHPTWSLYPKISEYL